MQTHFPKESLAETVVKPCGGVQGITDLAKCIVFENAMKEGFLSCGTSKESPRIPFKQVNDGYCDCEESGIDEIGTAGCSYISRNLNHFSCTSNHYIYSSRMDDGFCDCCDGKDERKITCPNHCINKPNE